jgi:23S rRNA G2445 N2-methylase RlmL
MVCGLFFAPIPQQNEATINQLVGIMSAIQLGIIGFYFGGSKLSETSQKLFAASKERADATIQEIAKAPVIAAVDPSKTVQAADMNVEVAGNVTVQEDKK